MAFNEYLKSIGLRMTDAEKALVDACTRISARDFMHNPRTVEQQREIVRRNRLMNHLSSPHFYADIRKGQYDTDKLKDKMRRGIIWTGWESAAKRNKKR